MRAPTNLEQPSDAIKSVVPQSNGEGAVRFKLIEFAETASFDPFWRPFEYQHAAYSVDAQPGLHHSVEQCAKLAGDDEQPIFCSEQLTASEFIRFQLEQPWQPNSAQQLASASVPD